MMSSAYGGRLRVGVIVPTDNVVTEPELYGLGVRGVTWHVERLPTEDRSLMRDEAVGGASTLATAGVDVLAYACSETSALSDEGSEEFVERLGAAAGAPAVTATVAITSLLAALGARSIVLVTPYQARYGAAVEDTYCRRGVAVARALHHEFPSAPDDGEWHATNRQMPETVHELARSVDTSDVDAIVLPATNLPTLPFLRKLASETGRPVLSGNTAIAWWCLRQAGLADEAERVVGTTW